MPTLDNLLALLQLVHDADLDTLSLGQRDHGLVAVADHEHVTHAGREVVASGVPDVADIEVALVLLAMHNGANATHVTTASHHDEVAQVELDELLDLVGGDVNNNGVQHADERVGVTDGAAIVGHHVGDALAADLELDHLAELVGGLLLGDAVHDEATLGVVNDAEVLISLFDVNNIHETGRVVLLSANLGVNLDQALHADRVHLTTGESVLQPVAEHQHQGQAFAQLVGPGGGPGGENATHFIKHPVPGGIQPLQMLLGPASHDASLLIKPT
mmetsp:Transcript_33645/g.56529  ORF Transcript_33645/g.56529 Transcript_33645/m.56529 type:complete len:273 (-) Transcript_33645:113-931(-)